MSAQDPAPGSLAARLRGAPCSVPVAVVTWARHAGRRTPDGPGGLGRWPLCLLASLCIAVSACGQGASPPDPEIPGLVARLEGSDPEDVNAAGHRLVEIGAPALEALELPATAPRHHRDTAIQVIGWMGAAAEPAIPWLMELLRTDLRLTVSTTLGKIGPAAVPPLIALLTSSRQAEVRRVACATLGLTRLRHDDIRRALLARLVDDPAGKVRDEAASALGAISFRDTETLRALERSADTNAPNDPFWAAYALAHLGSEGAEVLLRLAHSPHERTRAQAVGCLGNASEAPVEPRIEALLVALQDPSTWVRGNAAGALVSMGPPAARALPALREAAVDLAAEGDEVAAAKARDAVERLGPKPDAVPEEEELEVPPPPRPSPPTPR